MALRKVMPRPPTSCFRGSIVARTSPTTSPIRGRSPPQWRARRSVSNRSRSSQTYGVHSEGRLRFEVAEVHGPDLVRRLADVDLGPGILLNVNFPDCDPEAVQGLQVTRQGKFDQSMLLVEERIDTAVAPITGSASSATASMPRRGPIFAPSMIGRSRSPRFMNMTQLEAIDVLRTRLEKKGMMFTIMLLGRRRPGRVEGARVGRSPQGSAHHGVAETGHSGICACWTPVSGSARPLRRATLSRRRMVRPIAADRLRAGHIAAFRRGLHDPGAAIRRAHEGPGGRDWLRLPDGDPELPGATRLFGRAVPLAAAQAEERFRMLHLHNITTMAADGTKGWPRQAPFERIIVTAAAKEVPRPLITNWPMAASWSFQSRFTLAGRRSRGSSGRKTGWKSRGFCRCASCHCSKACRPRPDAMRAAKFFCDL